MPLSDGPAATPRGRGKAAAGALDAPAAAPSPPWLQLAIAGSAILLAGVAILVILMSVPGGPWGPARGRDYPWHTGIVATTFWVGEEFDPSSPDGSQVVSAYDPRWMAHYGGCDGAIEGGACVTERRSADNGFFPLHMTPKQNPFYLDLPFDDVNDRAAFLSRGTVIPWAADLSPDVVADPDVSLMKNRWVRIRANGQTCYGQIEDAGPGTYDDAAYVFGSDDVRPASRRYNNAGMDVSPALNGCLRFSELDGQDDRVDWQFVDAVDVPPGPWMRIVTGTDRSERETGAG